MNGGGHWERCDTTGPPLVGNKVRDVDAPGFGGTVIAIRNHQATYRYKQAGQTLTERQHVDTLEVWVPER